MRRSNFFYLNLIFWIGFSSLVYEIYSTRVLFLFLTQTSWAITIAISAFLGGLAFSSLIFSKFSHKLNRNNLIIIFWMQLVVATYGFFLLRNYGFIPQIIDSVILNSATPWLVISIKLVLMWLYLFIPAFFIGGSFPLVTGLYLGDKENNTRDTGLIYFWDTMGGIIGSIVTGFILLPYLGLNLTMIIASSLNVLIALVIAPTRRYHFGITLALIIIITIGFFTTGQPSAPEINVTPVQQENNTVISDDITLALANVKPNQTSTDPSPIKNTKSNKYPDLDKRFGDILFQEQSPYGLITIGKNGQGGMGVKGLYINYRDMCFSNNPSEPGVKESSESIIADLTVAKLPQNSKVLNIGLGCGFTAHAIESAPNINQLDIAEINPIVVKGTSQFFAKENGDVLHSPKTTLYIEDGAEFIRTKKQLYNSIIIDIEEPTIVDSSVLFTKEYFAIARSRLNAEGILSLWAAYGTPDFGKAIYNTLKSEFKYVSIRILGTGGFFTYYASNSKYDFPAKSADEQKRIDAVLNNPLSDINTIDNQILGKYFNIHSFFGLPKDYKDNTIKQ